MDRDSTFMRRALQLASNGYGHTSPNPMVGAVIVAGNRIIGEGWHRRCGEGHAEVNAVNSVREADRHLLAESTIYVTLEPCSHYGKTPPCAELIIKSGIRRVVVGCADPFAKVSGNGIRMLREAGIDVTTGVLMEECIRLNRRFMTAHTLGRPFIQLKWAQTSDGIMGLRDASGEPAPLQISTPVGKVMMHRCRAGADAIVIGSATALADQPQLTVREWPCRRQPLRVVADRRGRVQHALKGEWISSALPPEEMMKSLYRDHGVTSVMAEGGATLLQSLIDRGLWDEMRIEIANMKSPAGKGIKAPAIPVNTVMAHRQTIADGHLLLTLRNPDTALCNIMDKKVKNL